MIALMLLAGIAVWLVVVSYFSKWIVGLLHPQWQKAPVRALFFVVLVILPIADEIIGRWQFNRLCEREAVVWLSSDWENIKRASKSEIPFKSLHGYFIPIELQQIEYVDLERNQVFLSFKAFHTNGGLLLGYLGLGLGNSTSCWPKDWVEVTNKVNTDKLTKEGKLK